MITGIDMRGIYKTEGRARTTDLLDAGDIAILFHNRAVEWGRTYAQSWQVKRANGTLRGYQTTPEFTPVHQLLHRAGDEGGHDLGKTPRLCHTS